MALRKIEDPKKKASCFKSGNWRNINRGNTSGGLSYDHQVQNDSVKREGWLRIKREMEREFQQKVFGASEILIEEEKNCRGRNSQTPLTQTVGPERKSTDTHYDAKRTKGTKAQSGKFVQKESTGKERDQKKSGSLRPFVPNKKKKQKKKKKKKKKEKTKKKKKKEKKKNNPHK